MNQIEYYEATLRYKTDSWDLFEDLKYGNLRKYPGEVLREPALQKGCKRIA